MIHFGADFHLRHKNIIRYANRPFSSIGEHDAKLIFNWNSVVMPNDTVYFLGDFCLSSRIDTLDYISRLNGHIKFIFGNHDKSLRALHRDGCSSAEFLGDYAEITHEGQFIVLTHYSFRVWNKSHYGSWNLYGHSHGSLPDNPHALSIDVGVDCHNYTPISFPQVKAIMAKKLWKPIDHHGARQENGGIGLSKEDYEKLERQKMYQQLKREFE